jgi:putative ABC transport system permease protein
MIKNYLKTAIRSFLRHKLTSFLNVFGLGFGIALFILIMLYAFNEGGYDTHHKNYQNIYRVNTAYQGEEFCGTAGLIGELLKANIPEVVNFTRLDGYKSEVLKHNNEIYATKKLIYLDSSAFKILSFDVIYGDKSRFLTNPQNLVLTRSLSEKIFGEINPVGKSISINNKYDLEVIGVIENFPKNSHIKADAILPLDFYKYVTGRDNFFDYFGQMNYNTYILTSPKSNKTQIENKINEYLHKYGKEHQIDNLKDDFTLTPLSEIYFSKIRGYDFELGNKNQIKIFIVIGIIILLIAIINYINLATAQSSNRNRELGIRKVMGANRGSIIRQLLVESVALAIIATNIGIILVEILKPFFNKLLKVEISIGYLQEFHIIPIFLFGGLLIGLLAGAFPAIYISKVNIIQSLSNELNSGQKALKFRKLLIGLQFLITSVLVAGTLVVHKQMKYVLEKDLGFNKDQLLYFEINNQIKSKNAVFKQEVMKLPGAEMMAYSYASYRTSTERWGDANGEKEYNVHIETCDIDYIETLGFKIVEGRGFEEGKNNKDKILINETCARQIFQDSAIGRKMFEGWSNWEYLEVIGIIKDFSYTSAHSEIEPFGIVYKPKWASMASIKLNGININETIRDIHKIWRKISPDFPFEYKFVDEHFAQLYEKDKQFQKTFIFFALTSIIISCLGVFGLMVHNAQKRAKEIGLRKVNGATVLQIVKMLSFELSVIVIVSGIIAIPLSWAIMDKWLQEFAFRIDLSFIVFVVSIIIVWLVALTTISQQAIKIAHLNPADALRYE